MDDRDDAAHFLLPIVLVLALLAAALYLSTRGTFPEGDRPSVGGMSGGLALVYLISAGLLFRARERGQTGLASGIAVGASLLFALPAGFSVLWMAGWGMKGHATSGKVLALLAVVALVFMIVASRTTREARAQFLLGVVCGGLGLGAAAGTLGARFQREVDARQRERDARQGMEYRAREAVLQLTACALRAQATSAESTFVRTLAELPSGPDCAGPPLTSRAIDGYTLSYTPRTAGADARVTDFQLLAAPDRDSFESGTVVSDGRGLIFAVRLHEPSTKGAPSTKYAWLDWRDRGLGRILGFRRMLERVMEERRARGLRAEPASFDEIIAADTASDAARHIRVFGRDTSYAVAYAPREEGGYSLSVTCTRYGRTCLRSYLLAPDGRVHATGSPRVATAADPLVVEGEDGDGPVRGIVGWGGF